MAEAEILCSENGTSSLDTNRNHNKVELLMNKKRFKCNQCEYASAYNSNLFTHVKGVHGTKKFKCQSCDFSASLKYTLKIHMKGIHLKDKSFKCNQCEFATAHGSTLKNHINSIHEGGKNSHVKCANMLEPQNLQILKAT